MSLAWVFLGLAWCFVPPHKSWLSNNCFCWYGSLSSFHGKSWYYSGILNLQIFSSAHFHTLWEPHRPYCHIFSVLVRYFSWHAVVFDITVSFHGERCYGTAQKIHSWKTRPIEENCTRRYINYSSQRHTIMTHKKIQVLPEMFEIFAQKKKSSFLFASTMQEKCFPTYSVIYMI